MQLTSPEFRHNEYIPSRFTCQGLDINPPLEIKDVPSQAKSLVLIVIDPDAPAGIWVHWVVFDIPLVSRIEEDSAPGVCGGNTLSELKYHGPCPPSGTHRYFFKAYALDSKLNLQQGSTKAAVEKAMQGRILAQAELVGLYKKS